jgi:NadR type nicotinamide-nucleotide adenylyltransferase
MLKKIAVIGPESTGKSTLSEKLAAHYNTVWVPEYARDYLLQHGMNYKYEDLLEIAKGQLRSEDETTPLAKNDLLFVDTNMYVMKVWYDFVFGKCDQWILDRLADRTYDLYLLCNTDLPWIKDDLREYPDLQTRQQLFRLYKELMQNQNVPWVEISGGYEERMATAVKAVDDLRKGLLHKKIS